MTTISTGLGTGTGDPAVDAPRDARAESLQRTLRRTKRAYTTRRVDLGRAARLRTDLAPRSGDLVLARVGEIGQHQRIELPEGRRAPLREGEEVVVAYGARYAPDQFAARVPAGLGPCSLVAGGGVAGEVVAAHAGMRPATALEPLGILADADGRPLTVAEGGLAEVAPHELRASRPPVVAVVGAAMNSGKTTTVAKLVRGLAAGGVRVGAVKVTGTGAGGDVHSFRDHGAEVAYDFTDFGHATTAGVDPERLAEVLRRGVERLAADGCEAIVVEVADGVLQADTAALVEHPAFAAHVDGLLFAATDALCGVAGLAWLEARGIRPLAISGVVTASPLASEELRAKVACPVWDAATLADAAHAKGVLAALRGAAGR